MTLGEFRQLTKDLDDDTILMVVSECERDTAVALDMYPFETSLDFRDDHKFFLFDTDGMNYVGFTV